MKALNNRFTLVFWIICAISLAAILSMMIYRHPPAAQARALPGPQESPLQALSDTSMGWIVETVDEEEDHINDPSLELDTQDHPHISYNINTHEQNQLRYVWYDGSTWITETVAISTTIGISSLKLYTIADVSWGRVSFAAGDPGPRLTYALRDASGWTVYRVDDLSTGGSNSLALKSDGTPCIAYNGDYNDLKYACQVPAGGNCGPGGNTWQCDKIDDDASFYSSISLALDSAGNPHISYYDHDNAQLKYATIPISGSGNCGPSNKWQCDVIDGEDPAVDAGTGSSIIINADGKPLISYYDTTNTDLKLAILTTAGSGNCGPGNDWFCSVIDTKADGYRTSLAQRLEPPFLPRIAYELYIGTYSITTQLKLATKLEPPSVDWLLTEFPNYYPYAGYRPDLAIDSKGFSHMAYTNWDLMYARTGYSLFLPFVCRNTQGGG